MTTERIVEVNVISAHDLKDVLLIGKMRTYVVAWIEEECKFSTRVSDGGKNPSWNENIRLPIREKKLEMGLGYLTFEIYSSGLIFPKLVGSVVIRIAEVVAFLARTARSNEFHQCQPSVVRKSGREQGTLNLAIRLAEKPGQQQQQEAQPLRVLQAPVAQRPESRRRQNVQWRDTATGEGAILATYQDYSFADELQQPPTSFSAPLPEGHRRRRESSPLARLYPPPPASREDLSLRPFHLPSPQTDVPPPPSVDAERLARLYPPPRPDRRPRASKRGGARSGAQNVRNNSNHAANVSNSGTDYGGYYQDYDLGILGSDW